jgi:hypothetical protein
MIEHMIEARRKGRPWLASRLLAREFTEQSDESRCMGPSVEAAASM